MKAQASMEYILLFGFSLIIVGLLWAISGSNVEDSKWDMQMAYAKNSLDRMAQTADAVYIQGLPARAYIETDFPDNVNGVYLLDNSITMELQWKGMLRNLSTYTIANLTGYVNAAPGKHRLLILAGDKVNISESW